MYIYKIGVLTVNIEFMWRGLETGERRAFSESFHPFSAEPHKFYIYRQYSIHQYCIYPAIKFAKNVIQFNNKKGNGNPSKIYVPSDLCPLT
jgi:hypothetical protein